MFPYYDINNKISKISCKLWDKRRCIYLKNNNQCKFIKNALCFGSYHCDFYNDGSRNEIYSKYISGRPNNTIKQYTSKQNTTYSKDVIKDPSILTEGNTYIVTDDGSGIKGQKVILLRKEFKKYIVQLGNQQYVVFHLMPLE